MRTIDATIWSIVSQAGDLDIHYHVQDGASTDGTLDKIQAWATRLAGSPALLPSRVRFSFASEPDRGMYDAIAKGFGNLAIPSDAFMNWCNADDVLWPGALDAVARLGRHLPKVDWVVGWSTWFDALGRFKAIQRSPRFPQAILAAGLADGIHWPFVQQESVFWRGHLWDHAGGLNTSLRLAGDWDLWVRFARLTPLVHAHRQLGAFHVRPGQQSSDMERYRSEMDQMVPRASRQGELRKWVRRGAPLTTVPWVAEGGDGQWQATRRPCRRRAVLLARAVGMLPSPSPSILRLLHRLW
ncbi:MAG: glycosyl transferase family 2 [Nitrospirae bacterium]|nr:glycosyl transferase family 2 [Nitrospirota bacterium]